ncbi:hypothetical protein QUF56_11820 [Ureibacillus composti]|nr:hypothetical protein [Ureibacillus composti]
MKKFGKVGILVTSTALSFGVLSSVANAQTPIENQPERVAIEVASTETTISKNTLIKKLKELFPKQFDSLSSNDFYMSNGHYYPDDERIRYDLSFHKTVKGKDLYGSIVFVGDDLELETFHFEPLNTADALFPAKVSKEEAEKIAVSFLNKLSNGKEYEIDKDTIDYSYYSNQLITEPVRYEFRFVQKKNNVPLADQQIQLTILGNGEVVSFYRYAEDAKDATFVKIEEIKSENELLQKIKDNLDVSLRYQVITDYRTGDESIALIYSPNVKYGVNAISGDWQTANDFTKEVPKEAEIEKLAAKPLPARQANMTVEQAKKAAEQLLKIDSDKVKLTISSVEEVNYGNEDLLSVQYSYDWAYGGMGSSIEFNKATGEIVSYHDMKRDILLESGESTGNKGKLTEQQALAKALDYLKEWVPSYLNNYAKPIDEPSFFESQGTYYFTFPRVVNGILVEGHQINVGVGTNGSVNSLYINHRDNVDWPSPEEVVSKEEAKNKLTDALSLKLQYIKQGNDPKDHDYKLVYTPIYNGEAYSYLDANTGEWSSLFRKNDTPVLTHPTAEAELNYLLQNRMLEIKDAASFNADSSMTNGEALKLLVKSLSYFYEFDTSAAEENANQTYANIGPDHPYYSIVERAVRIGIINADETFKADAKLTREQLAVWYIRALGLETAAKEHDIYKLSFADSSKIQNEYRGYVALADALELVSAQKNQFNPKGEVTYADVAVSIFSLAQAIHETGTPFNQY